MTRSTDLRFPILAMLALLPLPAFIVEGGIGSWRDIVDGLDLTGHFIDRDLLTDRSRPIAEARGRLVDRLRRAAGLA